MNILKRIIRKTKKAVLKKTESKEQDKKIGSNAMMFNSTLAEKVRIGRNCYLRNCKINNYSYLAMNVTMMNTEIGKFCSIAQGACISLGMHPSHTFVSSSPVFFSIDKQCGDTFADKSYFQETGKCMIGNDVWVGVNAIIRDDVKIGDGAIVGAGAIVTKDVPPYAIVVGNPAKILKYRFEKHEIDFLLHFKWWDKDENWLRENFKDFHNISVFIQKHQ